LATEPASTRLRNATATWANRSRVAEDRDFTAPCLPVAELLPA